MDSTAPKVDSIPLSSYVASAYAYAGGMRQQSFQGIRRGFKVLPSTGVVKECPYVEIYCDPEQTANRGIQAINEDPDSCIYVGDEVFKPPLYNYKIVEPPSIIAYHGTKTLNSTTCTRILCVRLVLGVKTVGVRKNNAKTKKG